MSAVGTKRARDDMDHEWDGDPATWPRQKRRWKKFKAANVEEFAGFPRFFRAQDPEHRGRIEADYEVPYPDDDEIIPGHEEPDGHGGYVGVDKCGLDPGDEVSAEEPNEFKDAKRQYRTANSSWFTYLSASVIGGRAEDIVNQMEAAKDFDGKKLEQMIQNALAQNTQNRRIKPPGGKIYLSQK